MDPAPLISTFTMIAIAEFGDKAQLAAITLSSRHKPTLVFLGTILAVALVDGISVLIGQGLAGLLSMFWIGVGAGTAFILFGIYTLLSKDVERVKIKNRRSAFVTSFTIVALMELGDKTQFAIIALAAKYGAPALVFLGVMLAYMVVTGIGVTGGGGLARVAPMRYIRLCASAIFMLFGVLFLVGAIAGVTPFG